MNKKFLSAILFGTLMVASTGTFVSCGDDYDDDIKHLQDQIDNEQTTREGLASQLSSLKSSLESAQSDATAAKASAADALAKAQEALENVDEIGKQAAQAAVDAAQAAKDAADAKAEAIKTAQDEVAALQIELQSAIDDDLAKIQEKVDGLLDDLKEVLGTTLSSVTLVPDLYIGGIEAIEFKSISYVAKMQGGEVGLIDVPNAAPTLVSNGETIAKYRLTPMTVTLNDIDQAGVDFVANNAEVRPENRGVIPSPITVVEGGLSIDTYGILSVKCKKTITGSLIPTDGTINTVALKVPRAEDNTQVVYSEYARLSETTITPRIAKLAWDATDPLHHYSDSVEIWQSKVDAGELLTKEVVYSETLDLLTLVTGCYYADDPTTHTQITKDELKSYGLEFHFAIPTKAYNTNADNKTDQQQFAKLNGSVIISKLPNGEEKNRAAVGKEPIVRVTLFDVNNNQIVDQRYLKIKWIDRTTEPVALDPIKLEATLGCENVKGEVTWADFINNVYGAIKDNKLDMSEEQFHTVYEKTNMWVTYGYTRTTGELSYVDTDNEAGDALVFIWDITAAEINTIDQIVGYKDLVADVEFRPNNIDYPVLTMKLTMRVKLPAELPSINGYYDNYWFSQYDIVDVYPVQFETDAQTVSYCRYYNNLMNAFTYDASGFIVKNLPECGNWDMQFASAQPITGVAPEYYPGTDPYTVSDPWNTFEAYRLLNNGAFALRTVWDDGHISWCGNPAHYQCILHAEPTDVANHSLLNPLADTYKSDGIVPNTTHDKKITVKVFAAINAYNIIEVKKYDICLVAPLKINAQLDGFFEDQIVSGSEIDCANAFTLTDFAGYEVADIADDSSADEYHRWTKSLYDYYQVGTPDWDLDNIVVGMRYENGNCVVDDTITAAEAEAHMNNNAAGRGLTLAELSAKTNGNIKLSITKDSSGTKLVFKNNGGSKVEQECNVFIKASVGYGFGTVSKVVSARVYPHGEAPQK